MIGETIVMLNNEFVILNILFPFNEGIEMLYEDRNNLAMINATDNSKLCVYLNENNEIQLRHFLDEVEASLLKLTAHHIMTHKWAMIVKVNRKCEAVAVSKIQLAETNEPVRGNNVNNPKYKKLVPASFYRPIA